MKNFKHDDKIKEVNNTPTLMGITWKRETFWVNMTQISVLIGDHLQHVKTRILMVYDHDWN